MRSPRSLARALGSFEPVPYQIDAIWGRPLSSKRVSIRDLWRLCCRFSDDRNGKIQTYLAVSQGWSC